MKGFLLCIFLGVSASCFASTPSYKSVNDDVVLNDLVSNDSISEANNAMSSSDADEELIIDEWIKNFHTFYNVDPLVTTFKGIPIDGSSYEFKSNLLKIGFVDIIKDLSGERDIYGSMFDRLVLINLLENSRGNVFYVTAIIPVASELEAIDTINEICSEFQFSTDYHPIKGCRYFDAKNAKEEVKKLLGQQFVYAQVITNDEEVRFTKQVKTTLVNSMPLYQDSYATIDFLAKCLVNSYKKHLHMYRAAGFSLINTDGILRIYVSYTNLFNEPDSRDF